MNASSVLCHGRILLLILMAATTLFGFAVPAARASTLPQPVAQSSDESDGSVLALGTTLPWRMSARLGPGLNYEPIAVVTGGTQVEVIDYSQDGAWVLARIPGVDNPAWIPEMLLRFEEEVEESEGEERVEEAEAREPTASSQQPTATEEPGELEGAEASEIVAAEEAEPAPSVPTAYTQPQRMNVRSGPGLAYNVLTSVPYNTAAQITAIGPTGQWLQVQVDGVDGSAWLYRDLTLVRGDTSDLPRLSEEEIPPPPTPEPVAEAARSASPPASSPSTVVDAPLPTGGGSFGYGLQAHMIHTGQEGLVMDKTRELGFTWVKQQIEWKIFESSPGQYGFGDIGPIVGAANLRGINLLFSVVNAPDWAREPGFDPNVGGPPADPQTYANFVGALAREYCGSSLKAIEVWNEQNLHYEWGNKPLSPADYMNLLRPAYAAIKAACPSMYVISGALTPTGDNGNFAMDDFRYLEGMFQNGLVQYADGIGAHPSGYNVPPNVGWQDACAVIQQTGNSFNGACDNPHHSWSFRSTMEGYRNIAVKYGAGHLRIWPTEFGWAAGGAFDPRYAYADDNSFEEQAQWTVEAFQMMKNWGWVGPAFLWNLNFRVVADGTEKAQWGIVTNDWRPLPVFHALRDMPK